MPQNLRPYPILIGLVVVVVAAVIVVRGEPEDPETQIRWTLAQAAKAAQERDLGDLMDLVSEKFEGKGMDRRTLKQYVFVQLQRGAWRRVFFVNTVVEVQPAGTSARVKTGAILASGENVKTVDDVAGTDAGSYRFDLTMELEEGDTWRVTTAQYEPTPLQGLIDVP